MLRQRISQGTKVYLYVFLSLLGASWCAIGYGQAPKLVEWIEVQPTSLIRTVNFLGIIKAEKETLLRSEVAGVIQEIRTCEGKLVKKGEILALLKNDELQKSYELAVANEKVADAHYERLLSLFNNGQLSRKDLEAAQRDNNEAEIKVQEAKKKLEQTIFTSPFDGVCEAFKIGEGASIKAGDEIVTLHDPEELRVEFSVPEWTFDKIQIGQKVFVNDCTATIHYLHKSIDPKTHMGLAKAALLCPNVFLGMVVQVKVETDHLENVFALPPGTVFMQDGKQFVYTIHEGIAVLTPVITGLLGDNKLEIVSGLKAGDKVILRGQNRIYPGMLIAIQKKKNESVS